jgi:nucleotide-binding universal stress UspA family protein
MSAVLTAIRGGPESRATLERAAELARERKLPLHLLYVVNLDFLSQVTGGHIPTAEEEVTAMGAFILEVAKDDLEGSGVEVVTHVRQGQVYRQVIELANELAAAVVVVGRRRPDPDHPAGHSVVLRFAERIRSESGAEVVVVDGGGEEERDG